MATEQFQANVFSQAWFATGEAAQAWIDEVSASVGEHVAVSGTIAYVPEGKPEPVQPPEEPT